MYHPPQPMAFPAYAMNMNMNMNMNIMPEHYDMMGHGLQPNIDVHSMFYAQMPHNNNTNFTAQPVHNQAMVDQQAPAPQPEQDESMKKYASVRDFTEHQSSDDEENNHDE
eukprot:GDKK01047225.1.p1 GENE.GDKK01047225.1~~GDKK01047225.1.p1  ORF type:complete len:110 (+),score=18.97 GDKK01047225.1:64-393(+)